MTTTTTPPEIARLIARYPDADWTHEPQLPLKSIDLIASITNQVRDEPLDQATVDRYVADLQAGDAFPPIIVRHLVGTLVNLGGNHRTRAHIDAGRTTIDAWAITCDDLTALEIAYADNATHGLPPTEAERLAHCLVLMDHGRSGAEAARTVGIHEQRLYKHIAARNVEKRAADLGVTTELETIGQVVRIRLGSIQEDRLFVKIVRTISAEQMGQLIATRLIGDVNAQPDIASAMDVIQLHVNDHRNRAGGRSVGRPSTNPHIVLRTALGTVRGVNAADVVHAARTHQEREQLAELCMAGARHLKAIHDLAKAAH